MLLSIKTITAASIHLGKIFSTDVKATVAFKLKHNMSAVEKVLKDFDATKKALIERLCDKNEAGEPIIKDNAYSFTDPVIAKCFHDEHDELLKQEVEVDIKTVPMAAFEKAEISAAALFACEFMIVDNA
jgi:hypothetical protein